ncbi:MAG: hypothetical protein KME10_28165 [Plectolyngbya sp. WJT66-NPBG17]|jgi:hypothetical protein|nr:hypothetical protein [Plectolyngbya sp. WJT66-NPBG17]
MMQLRNLTIGLALTIAAISTQSAAWSFTPNNPSSVTSTESYQLPLQPVTSGEAASQSFDTAPKGNSSTQQPTMLRQSSENTELETKSLNDSRNNSTDCQIIPQTSGGNAMKQLDTLSKCNSGN